MQRSNQKTVLVLGDDNRSCLAVVRSLGRRGIPVWLGTATSDTIVPHSRYVQRTVQLTSTETRVETWIAKLRTVLEANPIELVIPCSDTTLVPLVQNRAELEGLTKLAIPSDVAFEYSQRKNKTLALARELSVPIPNSIEVDGPAAMQRLSSAFAARLPLIVKPVASKVWHEGRRYDLRVSLAKDLETLQRTVGELTVVAPVLIQDYFPGVGVGQEFLVKDGVILEAFQHQRVHEPLGGGGSSYRKGVQVDEGMLRHSTRMLSHLRWTGVAMVEYRLDPSTGEFVLMEINGRFWGSLPLATASGADFPYHLYQLLTNRESAFADRQKVGLYGRNLRNDIGWAKERVQCLTGRQSASMLVKEIVVGIKRVVTGKERWDALTLDDPQPAAVEILRDLRTAISKVIRAIQRRFLLLMASFGLWRKLQRRRFSNLVRDTPNVLFVCRGNICRSPFAQEYARLCLDRLGLTQIKVESAGTFPKEGRQVPEVARKVSTEFNVSLDAHRSVVAHAESLNRAGAIICMDFSDYARMRSEFSVARSKLIFMSAFVAGGRTLEISDPWSKPAEDFRSCYRQLSLAVDGLIKTLLAGERKTVESEKQSSVAFGSAKIQF